MKEKIQRITITVIALVTLINGIKAMNSKNNIKNEEESIAVSNTSIENVQSSEFNNLLYDNEIDYINIINDYLDNNKDLANIEYNKAVYMLLYNSNVDMNLYLDELNTILMYNQVPSDISKDNWNESLANLITVSKTKGLTSDASLELGRLVLPLAAYIHAISCPENCTGLYNPDTGMSYECPVLTNNKITNLSLRK